jgi:hypothetical protein
VATIEQDLLNLRAHPGDLTSLSQMATLADNDFHEVDTNGDGQIAPVVGEAGAITAFQQGELMATLILTPAA